MRSDSQNKEDGMDSADNVVVTYSRVTPAPLEPPEPRARGPLFEGVEVPHVRADRRGPPGIDPASLDGIVPDAGELAAPRKRGRPLGRVVLLGVVALAAGIGILAVTFATAMRTAPQKGTPPASAAVGTVPPAASASVPAAAPPAATAAVPPRQVPLGGKGPDFSSATIGPQPEARPASSAPAASATVAPAEATPPPPKARPEQSAKAVAPVPAPAATPQASPPAQPRPGNSDFTANIERLLSRPVGDPTPPPTPAALPRNPVVVVPEAPPVAALPDAPMIGAADAPPLPAPQIVPPANIGTAPPSRFVPPADIPNVPPSGTGGGLGSLQ
jgi:hypothetical protein